MLLTLTWFLCRAMKLLPLSDLDLGCSLVSDICVNEDTMSIGSLQTSQDTDSDKTLQVVTKVCTYCEASYSISAILEYNTYSRALV